MNYNVILALKGLFENLDSIRLVLLYADHKLCVAEVFVHILAKVFDTVRDKLGMSEHHSVVTGYIGLTLCRVNKHGVNLVVGVLRLVELCPGGESCSAETDDTAISDRLQEAVAIIELGSLNRGIDLHKTVALDVDSESFAAGNLHGSNLGNSTRNGSVYGRGKSALFPCDELADTNVIANVYDGFGIVTRMHIHRQYNFLRRFDTHGNASRSMLIVGHVQR